MADPKPDETEIFDGERTRVLKGIASVRRTLDAIEMIIAKGGDPQAERVAAIIAAEKRQRDKRPVRYARFKLEKDEEVRDYIRGMLEKGDMTQTAMAADCLKRFGKARAPTQSSLGRYMRALQEEQRRGSR